MSEEIIHKWKWQGGTAITNLMAEDRPTYEAAIAEYGDKGLMISDTPMPDANGVPIIAPKMYSLHDLRTGKQRSLADFWKIFNDIKKNRQVSV